MLGEREGPVQIWVHPTETLAQDPGQPWPTPITNPPPSNTDQCIRVYSLVSPAHNAPDSKLVHIQAVPTVDAMVG
ncbi:hypothetical protein DPEC_G00204190 [Dallia pectoralis]|uniref:Uncharacterized protein n=1 Tax=Dallia pectoralis TaxID=75939 RepID=A0ACC2G9T4_DALPE|nr:hypothetical protein DPEC_G00204190 [Dallia pectoralis]